MQQVVCPGGGATTPSPLTLSWLQSRVLTATKQCCVVNVKKRKVSTQQSRSAHVETLTHHTSSFCLLLHHYCLLLTLYLLLSLCLEVAAVIYLMRRLNEKQDVSGRFRPLRVDEVFVWGLWRRNEMFYSSLFIHFLSAAIRNSLLSHAHIIHCHYHYCLLHHNHCYSPHYRPHDYCHLRRHHPPNHRR